jgi:hypothetical protein
VRSVRNIILGTFDCKNTGVTIVTRDYPDLQTILWFSDRGDRLTMIDRQVRVERFISHCTPTDPVTPRPRPIPGPTVTGALGDDDFTTAINDVAASFATNDRSQFARDQFGDARNPATINSTARQAGFGDPVLVSVNATGTDGGNGDSEPPVLNADATIAAYESLATDIVATPADTNNRSDIYAREINNGVNHLVSINHLGTGPGNDRSFHPLISADGRLVAFESHASDLAKRCTSTRSLATSSAVKTMWPAVPCMRAACTSRCSSPRPPATAPTAMSCARTTRCWN